MFKALILSVVFVFHPVHVSVTSIEYVKDKKLFTVSLRMNLDDFIKEYKLIETDTQKTDFTVIRKTEIDEMDNYLNTRFSMIVNMQKVKGNLTDLKIEGNDINAKMEVKCARNPKTISVKSLIMTSIYTDQSNMIILKVNDFEEGFKLTSDITEQTFTIK